MKKLYIPLIVFFIGVGLIILSIFRGEAEVALFLIFPVIYGSGVLSVIGIFMIFGSFLLFFFLPLRRSPEGKERREEWEKQETRSGSKFGGVVFIGPIPIVFGKDKSITKVMLYIGLIIALILLVVYSLLIFV